jgi:hypothetical protein
MFEKKKGLAKTNHLAMEKFPLYSPMMLKADQDFLLGYDPSYFLRLAAQFQLPAYQSDSASLHEDNGEHDLLPDNIELFEATKTSFLHQLRYLSSEAFLLLLISGYPFGPTLKVLQKVQGKKLIGILDSLAQSIPPDLSGVFPKDGFKKIDPELCFEDWLRHCLLSGNADLYDSSQMTDLAEFVANEAKFVGKRDAINAFKHGRIIKGGLGQGVQISLNREGNRIPLLAKMNGFISWLSWSEGKEPAPIEQHIFTGIEEANNEDDYEVLKFVAGLSGLIKRVRLFHLQGCDEIKCFAPDPMKIIKPPQRVILKETEVYSLPKEKR